MKNERPTNRCYLLRLWWTSDEGTEILRIYIEDPYSGERKGFASLERLTAFLRDEVGIEESTLDDRDSGEA